MKRSHQTVACVNNKESPGSRVFAIEDLATLILDYARVTAIDWKQYPAALSALHYRLSRLMLVNRMFGRVVLALVRRDLQYYATTNNHWLRWFQTQELDIIGNHAVTLDGMTHLTALKTFRVSGPFEHRMTCFIQRMTTLTDLTVHTSARLLNKHLVPLTGLTTLSLRACPKISDAVFTVLTNLVKLTLDKGCHSIGGHTLCRLPSLKHLSLANNDTITDLVLLGLPHLHSLDLQCNPQITNLSLQRMTNLTGLNLDMNTRITPLGISHLTGLIGLSISNGNNISVECLQRFTNIESLTVIDNRLIRGNLSELSGLTKLSKLAVGRSCSIETSVYLEIYRIWPGLKELGF